MSKSLASNRRASLFLSDSHAVRSERMKKIGRLEKKPTQKPKLLPRIKRAVAVESKSELELEKRRNLGDASSLLSLSFLSLGVPEPIANQLRLKFNFEKAALVQSLAIPEIMAGRDVLVQSQTGSGKTLAFLVPILSRLTNASHERIRRDLGTLAIVLCPTRELCIQTHHVVQKLARMFPYIVTGVVMGGQKLKSEKASLRKGVTILICTPGRLLDHIRHTSSFQFSDCEFLILDEADRLLDLGFEADLNNIAKALVARSARIQCALLSATLDKRVTNLGSIFLRNPIVVDCSALLRNGDEQAAAAAAGSLGYDIPKGLCQGYVVVPDRLRLVSLASFLRWKIASYAGADDFKAIVFVSTCDQVEFFHRLFNSVCWPPQPYQQRLNDDDKELATDDLYGDDSLHDPIIPAPLFKLHGNMLPNERTKVFQKFAKTRGGVMISTDVAARGLDLPSLDWIVQFNPPTEITDYIHRIGRTARIGRRGRALIVLSQMESEFISVLGQHGLQNIERMHGMDLLNTLKSEKFVDGKPGVAFCNYAAMSKSINRAVEVDLDLKTLASRAFISYTRSYATYPRSLRTIFSVQKLHLGHVASGFGLTQPPSTIISQQRATKRSNDAEANDEGSDADLELDKFSKASVAKDRFQFSKNKSKRPKYNPIAEFAA